VEHVISTLAQDSGVLRTKHGDRLVVLCGRGVGRSKSRLAVPCCDGDRAHGLASDGFCAMVAQLQF
jgi:hypothetical protein